MRAVMFVAMAVAVLAPVRAPAQTAETATARTVQTARIGDQTVVYDVFPTTGGVGMSREELQKVVASTKALPTPILQDPRKSP